MRHFTYSFLTILICLTIAQTTSAQILDISSGGQPTITGAVGGSVSGSADVRNNLVVTVNFGEVSPLNPNQIVKVIVPIGIRGRIPYQVSVSISGVANANPQALQASDVGLGIQNMRQMGNQAQVCNQSAHIIRSPFNNDPATSATIGGNGRVTYPSSLASLSGSTVLLSGPRLTRNNSPN
ncbi:MAG TPA: hypothetical protein VHH35_08810, partial [Pyrinomonadaceae bacterium]|nr:hypothetical protein [Pyrinomonadaceae bacterium]